MTSKIIYTGALSTTATHLKSGTDIVTDAPTDNNGKGQSFSPTDLVATALASCAMTIMGIKANADNIDIDGATAEVTKTMASNPRRISKIEVNIQMPKGKNYTDKEKKILEAAATTCPVAKSLHNDLEQAVTIHW